ncbi:MAG: helix-turn-helix transcriptional regulator, partial [Xenococcus sp. (in: cyanobacteria)]
EAISSAIENIKNVIPQAILINVLPDFVGVTDIAKILGCSRQNVRKLILKDNLNSPPAVYEGAQSIWHLADVLTWLVEEKAYSVDKYLIETATIAMNLNIAKQYKMLDPDLQANFKTLVA